MHDLVLDVEVEFPAQEAAQILVDEVIECVPGSGLRQVLLQHRAVFLLFGRSELAQFLRPLVEAGRLENGFDGLLVKVVLLFLSVE